MNPSSGFRCDDTREGRGALGVVRKGYEVMPEQTCRAARIYAFGIIAAWVITVVGAIRRDPRMMELGLGMTVIYAVFILVAAWPCPGQRLAREKEKASGPDASARLVAAERHDQEADQWAQEPKVAGSVSRPAEQPPL